MDEVEVDVSKVEESSFYKLDFTDPTQIFDAHRLEDTNLSPYSFHFSVGFYIKIMFWAKWFYIIINNEYIIINNNIILFMKGTFFAN